MKPCHRIAVAVRLPGTRFLGTRFLAILLLALAALVPAACGGEPEAAGPAAALPGSDTDAAGDVEYEAAYPDEVSDEALSDEDVTQQAAPHSHGDETHAHEADDDHDDGHDH